MALDYTARYPGQTIVDPNYPQGKARNIATPGDGTGTPWEADLTNDLFGFLQSILLFGTLPASGVPDTAFVSQYLTGLSRFIRGQAMASNWTARPNFGTSSVIGMAASNNLDQIVTVGANSIQRSSGGIEWQTSTPATITQLNAVVYGNGPALWCAVGDSGEIQTSVDGSIWLSQLASGSQTFQAITWSDTLSLFCAVGSGGVIETSPNGVGWSPQISAGGTEFRGITYIDDLSLFVAVGNAGTIETSPNGIAWTARTAATAANLRGVAYSPLIGRLVAVGAAGQIDTSTDAINWSQVQTGGTDLNDVFLGTVGVFVAVGDAGHIKTSQFGDSGWSNRQSAGGGADLQTVTYDFINNSYLNGGEASTIQQSQFL